MRRRDFITILGGAAAWPLAARAQQMPVVGILYNGTAAAGAQSVAAFREGLGDAGYVEAKNVAIELRFGQNQLNRLPELVAELVHRKVAVLAALGGLTPALAAKAATATIPIVFTTGGDPVKAGLVASLNRPGGNVTGATSMAAEVTPKRLGLLNDLLPGAARFAVLVNPNGQNAAPVIDGVHAAAATIRRPIEILSAASDREIDAAFARLAKVRADALLVAPFTLFGNRRVQIVTLATRHGVPTIYYDRDFVEAGGLMSYGGRVTDVYRQAGAYAGRILKGEKPSDLPVVQAAKFELVINLQTARTLGIAVPATLLAQADEVIE